MQPAEPQSPHTNTLPSWMARRGLIIPILFFFICLFIFFKINGPLVMSTSSQNDMFMVTGTAEEKAVPSDATFSFSVIAKNTTQKGASDELNTRTKKILDDIKKLGIEEKDIKTTNLQTNPEYPTTNPPQPEAKVNSTPRPGNQTGEFVQVAPAAQENISVTQWNATESIQVRTKSVDLAKQAISVAESDGAEPSVSGISFTFGDDIQKNLEQKARIAAIKDAKQKAEELAKESGIRLGRLVNITESNDPQYGYSTMKAAVADRPAPPETQLNPGQNSVTKTVTLFYETR